MLETDEITKSLPPPRDDEPASLRQDIVDEIRDHIQCSLRRELLVGRGDETAARQRVLDKFGNPHLVARRLWFQAMWSKIMTQRLVIGSLVCSMVVSITLVVMVGVLMGRMDQQQRDQQAFNAALIEKVGSLVAPPAATSPRDLNFSHLEIKVTAGSKDGPPATDVQVLVRRLSSIDDTVPNQASLPVPVDTSGLADCGLVKPGNYEAIVITSWNEQTTAKFTIPRGEDRVERIATPEKTPEMEKVWLKFQGIPEEIIRSQMLLIRFPVRGERDVAGRIWRPGPGRIIGKSTTILAIAPDRSIWMSEILRKKESNSERFWPPTVAKELNWIRLDPTHQLDFPENAYGLAFDLITVKEGATPADPNWRELIDTSGHPVLESKWYPHEDWTLQRNVVNKGMRNEWTIKIPEEILKRNKPSSEMRNELEFR